jgi:ADP-heptose:LPS heptosyltransferase
MSAEDAARASSIWESGLSMDKILLVRVGALGDTLMVTPAVRALKNRYPNAEIDFLCSESAAPLLELNRHLARLYRIRRRNLPYLLSPEKHTLAKQLHSRNYDTAFLLETAPRYHQLLRHAKLPHIGGFSEIAFDPAKHCIENYLNAVGFPNSCPEDLQMELPVALEDEAVAERLMGHLKSPRIGLQVGYGPRQKKDNQTARLKGWSLQKFQDLSRLLLERGASLIFTGSMEDQEDVVSLLRQLPQDRVLSIAGRTSVRELAAVQKRADLFISVDTGPAHMAAALGVPLIVLWGPAIYEQVRPISHASPVRILRVPPPCAPCYASSRKNSCRNNLCMENISPDMVLNAAQHLTPGINRH